MTSIVHKPIAEITLDDIQELIDNAVPEGRDLEYKRELHGNSDSDKKEYLKDVTSFANTHGGLIIYGIEEKEGVPIKAGGITISNVDQEIQRLENIHLASVSPRMTGIDYHTIALPNGNTILIQRIPDSWQKPHMARYKGSQYFTGRNANGKYDLDMTDIKNLVNLSGTAIERIRKFREERVEKIIAGETPIPISYKSKLILHLLPLSAFMTNHVVDLKEVTHHPNAVLTSGRRGTSQYNLEGVVIKSGDSPESGYLQLYRTGEIESVDAHTVDPALSASPEYYKDKIPGNLLTDQLRSAIDRYLQLYRTLGIEPPLIVMLSVVGSKGFYLTLHERHSGVGPIDRPNVSLPPLVLESYPADIGSSLQSTFDILWQAFGWERCLMYDAEGNWQGS